MSTKKEFPSSNFAMINVGGKRVTRRRAIACGTIVLGEIAYRVAEAKTLPKGDCVPMAEIAGVMGAKNASNLLPMCHPLSIDQVRVFFEFDKTSTSITAYCEASAEAKTGVEMEALAGVNSALLCVWDLCKGTEPALSITDIDLLMKVGGKSGLWINPSRELPEWVISGLPDKKPLALIKVAVLVMSDRASIGEYEDSSGNYLKSSLTLAGAEVCEIVLIPDDPQSIKDEAGKLISNYDPHILICTGGTGPGPRDSTPQAIGDLLNPALPGIGEMLRLESSVFTRTAWLSRMSGGLIGRTLVITLPGSLKAVEECFGILIDALPQAVSMIEKQGRKGRLP